MNIHVGKRLFVVAAVLGAVAIFATGFFVALGVRSVVAGPGSAPVAQVPPVSHTYDQIELPAGTWTGLDADTLDGLNSNEIDDADDHVSSADHATTADSATTASSASTANSANTASYATNAGSANTANTASYATMAGIAGTAYDADTADYATDADTVDGKHANQIQDADDYVTNAYQANRAYAADYAWDAGDADNADTVDGYHAADLRISGSYCLVKRRGFACPAGFTETDTPLWDDPRPWVCTVFGQGLPDYHCEWPGEWMAYLRHCCK